MGLSLLLLTLVSMIPLNAKFFWHIFVPSVNIHGSGGRRSTQRHRISGRSRLGRAYEGLSSLSSLLVPLFTGGLQIRAGNAAAVYFSLIDCNSPSVRFVPRPGSPHSRPITTVADLSIKPVSDSPESIQEETIKGAPASAIAADAQDSLMPTVMEFSSSTMCTPSKQASTTHHTCSTDSPLSPMHPNNSSHEEFHPICL